jgi:hypothetical protein
MRFDVTSQVLDDPRSVERALWGGVGEPLEIAAASVHAEV